MPKETTPSVAEQADELVSYEKALASYLDADVMSANVDVASEAFMSGWNSGRASQAASHSAPEPVGWVSPEQLAAHPDGSSDASGRYLPVRKTPAGKFTMPIYAAPLGAESKACASVGVVPEEDKNYPFYELRFIMRVLSHKGRAPEQDWETAHGMAKEVFSKWHKERIAALASPAPSVGEPAVEAILFALATDDPKSFLTAWVHGDWDVIRREWPEAPEATIATPPAAPAVTEGASPTLQQFAESQRPLPADMAAILDANKWDLYALAAPAAAVPESPADKKGGV